MTQTIDQQAVEKMTQIVAMIVDRICFEITDPEASQADKMAQVQAVAATVAQGVFEAEFGSTGCSVMQVGKAKTAARINGANKAGSVFMSVAIDIVARLTPAQIVEAANRVAMQAAA